MRYFRLGRKFCQTHGRNDFVKRQVVKLNRSSPMIDACNCCRESFAVGVDDRQDLIKCFRLAHTANTVCCGHRRDYCSIILGHVGLI